MDEQQRINVVGSSSNSCSKSHDVFLSFHGEDTRWNFTSHLYEALNKEKVKTYIDDQLEKGDEISPALIKAIEDSRVSIVILSKNYASSKWCLGELSKILECREKSGQLVIPVFYMVDPTDVRKQSGSYEQAFVKHEGDRRCKQWKADLTKAANLAGYHSKNYRTQPEFLKKIVEGLLGNLAPRHPIHLKGLVGIEESLAKIESLLKLGSSEVITIGIWGMGGIGKTTHATALRDKLSDEFEGHCFLTNIGESSHELITLREKLFCKLLGKKDSDFNPSDISRLRYKKVLIVLDNVTTSEQFEKLIKEYDFLGPGSRVIVTTRDKHILGPNDKIYAVQDLDFSHSLQLFCLTAFKEKVPKDGYEELSRSVISYCKGVPLALKVFGRNLFSRSIKAWESKLSELQSIPNMDIHNVLKLSYDGLDVTHKDIFLDIACFFKNKPRGFVTSVLEAFDFFPEFGIEVLLDKALITISDYNQIEMHDLIREMGWRIVQKESEDIGRRSRLWKHEDVLDVLKHNKGTDVVEGIYLDLFKLTGDLNMSFNSLAKMTKLRFLQIHGVPNYEYKYNVYLTNDLNESFNKLRYLYWDHCKLEYLPSNFCVEQLVVLRMCHSNLKKLWNGVHNLVNLKEIDLSFSKYLIEIPDLSTAQKLEKVCLTQCTSLHRLHPSILCHPKLTYLDLFYCEKIESLNIHSKSMRKLSLSYCSSLKEISAMVEEMKVLDLAGCKLIESCHLQSKSLTTLSLNGCSSLKEISVVSEEMTNLDLSGTAIRALSSSMLSCPKLKFFFLSDGKFIESLDLHSKSLTILFLNGCSSLKEISVVSEKMTSLDLSGTAIRALSSSMLSCPKLENFYLRDGKFIESLDLHLGSLRILHLQGCSSLKEISVVSEEMTDLNLSGTTIRALSSSMLSCPKLEYFDLRDGKFIERFDHHSGSLRALDLQGCSSLKEISVVSKEMTDLNLSGTAIRALSSSMLSCPKLEYFYLRNGKFIERFDLYSGSLRTVDLKGCSSLKEISVASEEMTSLNLSGTAIRAFSSSMLSCPKLENFYLTDNKFIESLDLHSKSLTRLFLNGCSSLKEISVVSEKMTSLDLSGSNIESFPANIKNLSMLKELCLRGCRELVSLPELPPSLRGLQLDNCRKLMSLPELPPNLHRLSAGNCISLKKGISQQVVLQHMLHSCVPRIHQKGSFNHYFTFPRDHVMDECGFHTAEGSITISCLPISHLSGFIYCIILPKGFVYSNDILMSMYQDHVKVKSWAVKAMQCFRSCDNVMSEYHVMYWYDDFSQYDKILLSGDITFTIEFVGSEEIKTEFRVFPVYPTASGFKLGICESESIDLEQLPTSKRRRTRP